MHNKCIYVHDKIISYKTLYKNQQAMYKIISLSLWQQILATTKSTHNTCDRSSSLVERAVVHHEDSSGKLDCAFPLVFYYVMYVSFQCLYPWQYKVNKYYCQYLNPEGCVDFSWNLQTKTPKKNFSSPPQWQEATYCPNKLRSALVRVLGQSLVCPYLLQSVYLNQDLKALSQHLKCVPDWGENLVTWPDAIQRLLINSTLRPF